MAKHRTPKELIELYWEEVWNNRNVELIREICADPILRHDPGRLTTALSVEDQIARVSQQSKKLEPYFEHEVLLADDTHVCSVWNMRTRKGQEVELSGIEVFKAVDGKFTNCWNSTYTMGHWGRKGDKSVPQNLPAPKVISDVKKITADWVQRVFQAAGVDAERVTFVGSEPIGHGNMSSTVRTTLTYNANADKQITSLICKLPLDNAAFADAAKQSGVNKREVAVLKTLASGDIINTPKVYFAETDDEGRDFSIVMEDLSQRTRAGDQIAGCSQADAKAVVTEFAKLHSHFWGNQEIANASWIFNRPKTADQSEEIYDSAAKICRERFESRLDAHTLSRMDEFIGKFSDWTNNNVFPRTLIHGEPRVDNALFEDTGDSVTAWLIDWQVSDYGSPMYDTAYFMAGSLEPDDRAACEDELIAMQQSVIAGIDSSYTLDIARDEYARSLPFALWMTVISAHVVPSGEHTDKLLMTLLERNVKALDHWNIQP